jgi:hypothetical protein
MEGCGIEMPKRSLTFSCYNFAVSEGVTGPLHTFPKSWIQYGTRTTYLSGTLRAEISTSSPVRRAC